MELFKALFSGLAILSICVRVESRGIREIEIKDQQGPIKVKECYCLSRNSQSNKVSKLISPNGEQQDRLVVYLYKDINNKVNVFVPGKEKQRFLPDLTFDAGDKLANINSAPVGQLFALYPEFVIQSKDIDKPRKQTDDLPYNILDVNYIQTFPNIAEVSQAQDVNKNAIRDNKPNRGTKISWQEQSQIPSNDNIVYQENSIELPVKHNPSSHHISSNQIISKPKVEAKPDNTAHIIQIIPENFQIPAAIEIPHGETSENIGSESISVHSPVTSEGDNGQQINYENLHTDYINLPEDISFDNFPEIQYDNINIPFSDPNLLEFSDTVKITSPVEKPISSNTFVSQATSNNLPVPITHHQQIINEHLPLPKNIHPKFRNWFWDQIRILEMKRQSISKGINLSKLFNVILSILYRNGIQISSTGDLKDVSGNVIPITHLRLHSILLNNSAHKDNTVGNNCYRQKDNQNLKTVLVTLTAPPKILGIITLGNQNSNNSHGVNTPCKLNSCKNRPCCKKLPCYKKMKVNHISNNVEQPAIVVKQDKGSLLTKKPKTNSLLGSFIKSRRLSEDPDNSSLEEKPIEEFIFNDELQVVEDIDNIQDVNLEEYDDSLGIRIVGGTPATSSGTPVSIKGRSGITY